MTIKTGVIKEGYCNSTRIEISFNKNTGFYTAFVILLQI